MTDVKLKNADETFGYPFGIDGTMNSQEARAFLGNASWDTLDRLYKAGLIRKGKLPGGKNNLYCRRSVREYAQSLEV